MNPILGFAGQYRFLSNFYCARVVFEGERYLSVEHAYQAAKTTDRAQRRLIASVTSPVRAKSIGKKVQLRPNWEEIKLPIMRALVASKFEDWHLRELLLLTTDAYLEETNTWGDIFWGVCNGRGENHLGKILMEIRSEIRSAIAA